MLWAGSQNMQLDWKSNFLIYFCYLNLNNDQPTWKVGINLFLHSSKISLLRSMTLMPGEERKLLKFIDLCVSEALYTYWCKKLPAVAASIRIGPVGAF
jgi:hypothetical protein